MNTRNTYNIFQHQRLRALFACNNTSISRKRYHIRDMLQHRLACYLALCPVWRKNRIIAVALSDPNRLRIVQLLTYGEQCACELLEQMQIFCDPALSPAGLHQMNAFYPSSVPVVNPVPLIRGSGSAPYSRRFRPQPDPHFPFAPVIPCEIGNEQEDGILCFLRLPGGVKERFVLQGNPLSGNLQRR